MVPDISVNHGQSSGLEGIQNDEHRKSKACLCPIVLLPHEIHVSPMSESRLQHCQTGRCVHGFVEKVRSDQIKWPHTRSYHHTDEGLCCSSCLKWGSLLRPEHHISVVLTAIDGTFVTEKNHWAAPGTRVMCPTKHDMSHSADPCRHPTVHSRKSGDSAFHVSLHVVSPWPGTPRSDDRQLLWGTSNGKAKRCAVEN